MADRGGISAQSGARAQMTRQGHGKNNGRDDPPDSRGWIASLAPGMKWHRTMKICRR